MEGKATPSATVRAAANLGDSATNKEPAARVKVAGARAKVEAKVSAVRAPAKGTKLEANNTVAARAAVRDRGPAVKTKMKIRTKGARVDHESSLGLKTMGDESSREERMKYATKIGARALVLAGLLAGASWIAAYPQSATQQSMKHRPDNTRANKVENNGETADQQKNNSSDLQITRRIRRAIVQDKSLSMYAHNVKIITKDGGVTLKGPVNTEDEKTAIASKAAEVVGQDKVKNEIKVVPNGK